jgi:hypothetical protein
VTYVCAGEPDILIQSGARKCIAYDALMVFLFGGAFSAALAIVVAQPTIFMEFRGGKWGVFDPVITPLFATGLPAAIFLRELWRSYRSYRAVCNDRSTILEGKRGRSIKSSH